MIQFPRDARFGIANSIAVTPDDRWIVYARYEHAEADLRLIRDFRLD